MPPIKKFKNLRSAIALSTGIIAANCSGKYITSITKRDPENPHMPVINYNLALVSMPMIMFGSFFGVIFNETIPEGVLVIILITVITFSILSGLSKTLENYRRETELFEQWDMEDKGTKPE